MTVVEHHSVEELQTLFQRERVARLAKRLWIVWQAWRGHTAPEIDELFDVASESWCRYGLDPEVIKSVCDNIDIPSRS